MKNPIERALGIFKARTLPDELHDAPKGDGSAQPNAVPEKADALAEEAEALRKDLEG